jgi:hypothetical protein
MVLIKLPCSIEIQMDLKVKTWNLIQTKLPGKITDVTVPVAWKLAGPNHQLGSAIKWTGDPWSPWCRGGGGGSHSGERWRGKSGRQVKGEAGDEGNPFWGLGREDAHRDVRSMVRWLGGGKLTVAGKRRGRECRWVGRWGAPVRVSAWGGASDPDGASERLAPVGCQDLKSVERASAATEVAGNSGWMTQMVGLWAIHVWGPSLLSVFLHSVIRILRGPDKLVPELFVLGKKAFHRH